MHIATRLVPLSALYFLSVACTSMGGKDHCDTGDTGGCIPVPEQPESIPVHSNHTDGLDLHHHDGYDWEVDSTWDTSEWACAQLATPMGRYANVEDVWSVRVTGTQGAPAADFVIYAPLSFSWPTGMFPDVWVPSPLEYPTWLLDGDLQADWSATYVHWMYTQGMYHPDANSSPAGNDYYIFLPEHPDGGCAPYGTLEIELNTESVGANGPPGPSDDDSCTPGSGQFVLTPTGILPADADGSYELTPLRRQGSYASGRAWLRSIQVTHWGDADQVFARPYGSGWGSAHSAVLEQTSEAVQLDSGVLTMSAQLFSPGDEAWTDYPVVDLSWSCEVDEDDRHYELQQLPEGYTLSTAEIGFFPTEADHDLILRLDEERGVATLEPRGRRSDMIVATLHDIAGGSRELQWSFGDLTIRGPLNETPDGMRFVPSVVSGDLGGLQLSPEGLLFRSKK